MPHIVIKCYKGRSKEQLKKTADKIAACAAEELNVNLSSVSVSIEEVDKENWPDIYHKEIYGNRDNLYVEPQYTVD